MVYWQQRYALTPLFNSDSSSTCCPQGIITLWVRRSRSWGAGRARAVSGRAWTLLLLSCTHLTGCPGATFLPWLDGAVFHCVATTFSVISCQDFWLPNLSLLRAKKLIYISSRNYMKLELTAFLWFSYLIPFN